MFKGEKLSYLKDYYVLCQTRKKWFPWMCFFKFKNIYNKWTERKQVNWKKCVEAFDCVYLDKNLSGSKERNMHGIWWRTLHLCSVVRFTHDKQVCSKSIPTYKLFVDIACCVRVCLRDKMQQTVSELIRQTMKCTKIHARESRFIRATTSIPLAVTHSPYDDLFYANSSAISWQFTAITLKYFVNYFIFPARNLTYLFTLLPTKIRNCFLL